MSSEYDAAVNRAIMVMAAHISELAVLQKKSFEGENCDVPEDFYLSIAADISACLITCDDLLVDDDGPPSSGGGEPVPVSNVIRLRTGT